MTHDPTLWDGDGLPDNKTALDLCNEMEFLPDELLALYDHNKAQGYTWEKVARYEEDPAVRDRRLGMSRYFWRRAQRFREIALELDSDAPPGREDTRRQAKQRNS